MTPMTNDVDLRARILDVAAKLFAENGYGGTKLQMVAGRAGVTTRTVRRLTGDLTQLFGEVITDKLTSDAADRIAAAAAEPGTEPPLAVLLQAAGEIFAAPGRSWNVLEVEALIQAHRDDSIRALESARMDMRRANLKTVTEQTRRAGGIDDDIDDRALVHFAVALSAGLALLHPVTGQKPSQASWNALMARIGASVAPQELLLRAEHEVRTPWPCGAGLPR